MKIKYDIAPGCTIEQEVKDTKQGFQFIAYAQEVFGTKRCGNCGSPDVRLCYRTPQGYEYYSVKCDACHHELKFGQQKETGRLFPKGWEPGYQSDDTPKTGGNGPQYHNQESQEYTPPPQQQAAAANDGVPW